MSWPTVKLGNICERVSVGHVGTTSEFYTDESGIPFLRTQNVGPDGISLEDVKYITPEFHGLLKKSTLVAGDVVMSRVVSTSINCGVVPKSLDGANCANIILARPHKDCLDSKYLMYYLRSPDAQRKLLTRQVGSAQSVVNTSVLKTWEVPLPPLSEQKRIVAILDKADAIRRKRQQAIQLAGDLLRAVFLDMFGDPVANPKGFPLGKIRDLVESANYGSSEKASEIGGEYPMLRMGNITYDGAIDLTSLKYIDLSENDKPKYLVKKDDLLFNRTNSRELVGKTAVYDRDEPAAIAGYIVRVRANSKGNSYYISGYLNSLHGKSTLQSVCKSIVGMANINAQEMQEIAILVPPVELQKKFEESYLSVKEKLKSHSLSLKISDEMFRSLTNKAFSGRL